ncbi:rod shape-determining protein MreD [Oceanospirillum multiglobuliferum]|uniref:rod shape-determining protein MreD n=1 Tax=Oceanospirillum multiglobuliferum TaxID=64969 RepID=UPI0009CFAAB1|nr:rod shape-determining protein MreD [Oceanospirillum multiglobuliferum]SJZ46213.1 rod shape-determining protein MreD [Oceanospirillum multiglobuliferum]
MPSLIISLSFLFALLLSAMPLPDRLLWFQPEWVSMVLIYWCIALPNRVGVFSGFFVGLCVDLLEGALLGQNALISAVLAALSLQLYQRLRNYGAWQQAMMVGVLIGISLMIAQWIQNLTGVAADTIAFMLPALTSTILWPWLFIAMRTIRRRFQIR